MKESAAVRFSVLALLITGMVGGGAALSQDWVFNGHSSSVNGVGAGSNGNVYAGNGDDVLKKIDSSGNEEWSITPHSSGITDVEVYNSNYVYTSSNDDTIKKFDDSGNLKWTFSKHSGNVQSIDIDSKGNIYSVASDNTLKKIDSSGNEEWSESLSTGAEEIGIDGNNNIYIGNNNGEVKKYDSSGSLDSSYAYSYSSSYVSGIGVGDGGSVYAGYGDGSVKAVDSSGSQKWSFNGHSSAVSGVGVDSEGVVYSVSDDATVRSIDDQGNQIDSYTVNDDRAGSISVSERNNGRHYVAVGTLFSNNKVYRFTKKYNSPPTVSSTSVTPDPPVIGDALDVSASASDPDGSVQSLEVEIFQDGVSVFSSSTSSGSLDINDAYTVQEGTVEVKFTVKDDAGATTTDTITRTVSDTAPASPTINKPTGTFNTPTTQYDVTVPSDNDDFPGESLTLTLKKDGSQVDQVTTSEGSTVTGSFQTSTEGSHNFDVTVEEPDGETSTASSTYNVDFVDPTVDTLSVSPSPLEYETASDVTVDASDNVEVQEVCVSVDKDGSTFVSQTCRQTASGSVSETFTDFFTPDETNSDYTVSTTVTDNQGETGSSSQTFTLSNDAPSASGSFSPSTFGFDDKIDVSYSFSDPNGNFDQGTVTAFKDGSQVASTTVNSLSGSLTDFFTITETNSDYTVDLTATDLQGSSDTFSETQTVSNQAPTLSDSYTPSTWTFNDNVDINFDFNDANGNINTRSITVLKDGSQIQSFSPTQNDGTIQDAFLVDETGSTYKVELSATDLQGQTASGSTSQFVSNTAPIAELNATPSTFLLGDQIDLSYGITDNEGDVVTRELRIFEAGTKIRTIPLQNNTDNLKDVFEIDQRETEYQAQLFVEDSDGQTDSEAITQTISDNAPSVTVTSPSGEFFTYDHGIEFSVGDSDRVPGETYNCDVLVDGTKKTGFTLVEGSNASVDTELRSDLGSHSLNVTCSESLGSPNTASDTTSFNVNAFRFQGVSADSPVFETTNQTYNTDVRHGDMVENVDYKFTWNGTLRNQFTEQYTGTGTTTETTEFAVPLAFVDGTTRSYGFDADVNISDFNTGFETLEKNSTAGSQQVDFAYENPQVQLGSTEVIEDTSFTADLDFTNNLATTPADLTAETSFNGAAKTGFSPDFTAPLVTDANKSFTVTGDLKPSFKGRSDTRAATSDNVQVFRKILTSCTDPVKGVTGPQAQKLVLKNETEQGVRVQGDIEYNYDVSTSGSSHTRNYAFTETSKQTATTCLYPDFAEYQISGPVSYDSTGFGKRVFQVQNTTITDSSTTLPLFLLPDSQSTDTVIRVETPSGSAIDGTVKVLRFDVGTNTFTTAAKLETGTDGEAEVGLEDGAFYEFVVQNQDGDVIFTRDQEQFTPQTVPATVTLTVGQELPDFVENQDGFTFKVEEVKNKGNITGLEATVNHDTSALQNATLKVDKNAVVGENTICEKTVQTSASTLFCEFNETAEGNQFSFVLSSFVNGDRFVLQTGSIDKTKGLFGINQVFAGFLVFMSLSAFGFVTPRLTVMFSTAGVIAAYTLGLISVGVGAMASLVAVALIVTFAGERTV